MNKKYLKAAIAPLITTILLLAVLLPRVSVSTVSAQIPPIPKNEIIYGSGFWPSQTSFNPTIMDWGEGWDTYLMYEPLFGTNTANGQIMYWLGQSIAWVNSTSIKVTLRPGIYWVKMLANGSTVYDRPITTVDVNYTWYLLGAFPNSPTNINSMGPLRTRVSSFVIASDSVFYVNLNSTFANSEWVWRQMLLSYLIVPKDVWTQIVAAHPTTIGTDFANDWTTFPANESAWKVASGMYLPYWHVSDRTIVKRNDNWWGAKVSGSPVAGYPSTFGLLPAPMYMGYINYATNPPAILDLEAGSLDWCSIFIPGIADVMASIPTVHTYFTSFPYYADMSVKLMIPNYHNYLLSQPWLHKALASSLGPWDAVNSAGGGVLKQPSPLLLPADDAVARELLNTTIENKYRVPYGNVTYGLAILNQYCTYVSGAWYTKDLNVTDVNQWAQLYVPAAWGQPANASLTIGTVTNPAGYWATISYSALQSAVDALSATAGINVKLGAWNLLDIVGWTDVDAIDAVICSSVSAAPPNGLGISLTSQLLDYSTCVSMETSMSFDLASFCGQAANGPMIVRYNQYFNGTAGYYTGHYGDYRNPQLGTLIDSLDCLTGTAKQNVANQIETIIGSNLPFIPEAGHPNWFVYSNKYFTNWPSDAHPLLTAGAYGGSANNAQLQTILLGLKAPVTVAFSNIAISKANVLPGQNTTISVQVKNTGTVEGVTTVQLLVNGIIAASKNVTLALAESVPVSFTVSEQQIGTYQVAVGGLKTSFIVTAAPAVPAYIRGTVKDANTGNAISNATVIAGAYTTTTATNGSYLLSVANGTYIVTVVMNGYNTNTTSVNAHVQGTTYTTNIALTPLSQAIPIWVYGVIAVFVIIAVVALAYAFVFKKKKT